MSPGMWHHNHALYCKDYFCPRWIVACVRLFIVKFRTCRETLFQDKMTRSREFGGVCSKCSVGVLLAFGFYCGCFLIGEHQAIWHTLVFTRRLLSARPEGPSINYLRKSLSKWTSGWVLIKAKRSSTFLHRIWPLAASFCACSGQTLTYRILPEIYVAWCGESSWKRLKSSWPLLATISFMTGIREISSENGGLFSGSNMWSACPLKDKYFPHAIFLCYDYPLCTTQMLFTT